MSGGSMQYLYQRLDWEATFAENTPERVAFRKHLNLVAKALHDIEWVDSGDCVRGDDVEAIMACITKSDVLVAERERLEEAIKEAQDVLTRYE